MGRVNLSFIHVTFLAALIRAWRKWSSIFITVCFTGALKLEVDAGLELKSSLRVDWRLERIPLRWITEVFLL